MNGFLLRLCILTLVLSVCGGGALLFRLTRAGRCGRIMSRVWAAVLLLAILPIRLPDAWLPETEPLIELPAAVALPAAEPTTGSADFTVIARPTEPAASVQPIEAPARRTAPDIPALLFTLWLFGGLVMFGLSLRRNGRLCGMLRTCSSPCEDEGSLALLADFTRRAGLLHPPELRILDDGIPIPPCTAGIFRPRIYLPAVLPDGSDHLPAILAHELCHIRRRDIWRKLFALAVCSVHWFNPLVHVILPRVYEDLEPACDRAALRLLGGEPARVGYMQTLLEVAARLTAWQRDTLVLGLGSQKEQIERRFTSMKKTRLNKLYTVLALLLVCGMILGASIIFTACVPAKAADNPLETLTPLTDRIVRYYYDLAPEDEITDDMLEGITSLRLAVSSVDTNIASLIHTAELEEANWDEIHLPDNASEDMIAWAHSVIESNKSAVERYTAERVLLADLLEKKTLISFNINYADAAEGSYAASTANMETFEYVPRRFYEETICASVNDDWTWKKFNAFYCLKDAADETLTGRQRDEMLAMFPWAGEHPTYICDPARISRENLNLYYTMFAHGILDPQLLDSTAIDTAQFAVFPNLTTLELVGLTEAQ